MTQFFARLTDLTFAAIVGVEDSSVMNVKQVAYDAEAISFLSDSLLEANTYTIMVSLDGGVTYATLQTLKSDGTLSDFPFPAAGKALVVSMLELAGVTNLKIRSSGSIAATRTIQCGKSIEL